MKSGDKKANKPYASPAFLRPLPGLLFVWLLSAISLLSVWAAPPPAADSSGTPPTLLTHLEADIADGRLDDYSLIQSAFILSGAVREDSLTSYMAWYDGVLTRLRALQLDPFNRLQSASTVFSYLHAFYLLEYKEEATTLIDVVRKQKFNCVAGTILYNLVCADLGWPTEAFETPSHVYTIFPNFTQTVTVENTSPMGFNIMRNLQAYSAYLLSYYPAHRTAQIGLDKIYAYENSHGRRINNTELLGLLAYNRAYFARQRNDFAEAYEFVLLAQQFNRDSRSNVFFEQELYFRWGKELFNTGSFDTAFSVYADGAYRYPEMKELGQNCRASFFKALHRHYQQLNWRESRRLILEMEDLDLLTPEQQEQLNALLMEWADYLYRSSESKALRECLDLVDSSRMSTGYWQVMRRAAEALPE